MTLVRLRREQSQGEEIANSISHGIGLVAALVGTPFLITQAARHGNVGFVIGASLFSATTIFLYLASTLYHALPIGKSKRVFRVLEHSAIFLLIAGTYTPFTLGVLHGVWGWILLSIIWSLAAAGVVLKVFYGTSFPILSTSLYLLMGWMVVITADILVAKMPTPGLLWLIAGGLSYTVGVVFFAIDSRLQYAHLIWHLFVLTGTTCHYFAVLWYAA
ncbi:hemolysin III [Nitrosospira multiformis]|uniref:Hemolysin III n=1 Tax=Nitrosospira multiformis TaxID=1231 RepID=A0A1H9Z5X3_9PROT|nr:hemolysin III family protein [Nitrosospira multiformis]SES76266.1 hemolysin III [Nitrosospira multiformis]